jgi:hypothetical protein
MGVPINLESTGILDDVIKRSKELIVPRIENQIIKNLADIENGKFQYKTENSYNFQNVSFSLGNTTIKTTTKGFIERENEKVNISGTITFQLTDEFTDPLSLREINKKTSAMNKVDSKNMWTELGGTPYQIIGTWQIPLAITIKNTD